MRMTIDRMTISNFKGIRELSIDFGDVTRISGMNGTGKTTIPDAFSWQKASTVSMQKSDVERRLHGILATPSRRTGDTSPP